MNLVDLAASLARLDLEATGAVTLASEAHRIGDAVRDVLSHPPGDAHVYPWKQTGALQESIGVSAESAVALVGSTDPVAAWQEHGTPTMPPRPFLAPVALENAAAVAMAIGRAVATAIGGV